jgi:hypothetical protein
MTSDHILHPARLSAGQALSFTVRPGTTVQVLAGSVRVSEPSRWVAERMIGAATTLREGEAQRIEGGGWIEVLARGGEAQILAIEPASSWALFWRYGLLLAISAARRARLSGGQTSEAL